MRVNIRNFSSVMKKKINYGEFSPWDKKDTTPPAISADRRDAIIALFPTTMISHYTNY